MTHYLEEAEQLCRNIGIINHGNIVENTSTKDLLTRLDQEVFIFDTKSLPENLPVLPGFTIEKTDDLTLEITVEKGQSLNEIFALLDQHNISVASMRNKANRLEELFINLINQTEK